MPAVRRAMVLAGVIAWATPAHAGRTDYGWLFGSEVMPERGVEVQQWLWEENNKDGDAHVHQTSLWWGPVLGITDQLELSLPVELDWTESNGEQRKFTLARYGIDARYRFVSQDPVDKPAFAPLLRIAAKRDVTTRDAFIGEADLVATYDFSPSVQAAVDVGFTAVVQSGAHQLDLRPGVGVSIKAVGDLRLGVEAYAYLSLDDSDYSWAVVGPNLALTHGRFWVSAAFGIGVYQIDYAPRMIWGVLF